MKPIKAIIKATALSIISEPLSLLLLISGLVVSTLAPAFHYHQFGDPTRMAKDAGVSAIIIFGFVFASAGAIKSFRREIESGTAALALSHAVSRTGFFVAKSIGIMLALALFVVGLIANSITIVNGAFIGGKMAAHSGDVARLYGPSFLLGIALILFPAIFAAFLNRFARFRFCLTAFIFTIIASLGTLVFRFDSALVKEVVALDVLSACPAFIVASAASAFAARFRFNVASLLTVLTIMLLCPIMINYTQASSPLTALIAAMTIMLAFLIGGAEAFKERDLI